MVITSLPGDSDARSGLKTTGLDKGNVYDRTVALKDWPPDKQYQRHLGTQEYKLSGPTPDSLNQKLCFNTPST